MKISLFTAIAIFMTANALLAQNRDRPSPQPGVGAAGGAPGIPGGVVPAGGGFAPPGQPALGGGFPGGGGGGAPGAGAAGGLPGGGFPGGGMPGGMGGMGMPGLGFGNMGDPNRFQLFAGEVMPEGKDNPLPMVLKIDTQTGQVWQLQVGGQNKVRFVVIEGQLEQFNGPQRGFGGHPGGVPVDPTTGLPFSGPRRVAPAPQNFPTRPTRPTRRSEPR